MGVFLHLASRIHCIQNAFLIFIASNSKTTINHKVEKQRLAVLKYRDKD